MKAKNRTMNTMIFYFVKMPLLWSKFLSIGIKDWVVFVFTFREKIFHSGM